ncbi:MAG: class I SAM-dependent methyltransferase [Spirochaetia bacterium]|jgi:arsenite methyltransferase|nr:class I SAM-dependent methyltransferase [Spirochaetia bacterium]
MLNTMKLKHFNKAAEEDGTEEILKQLDIKDGFQIADIGSGGGYYTLKFADIVGDTGIVYAVDVDQQNLNYISKEVEKRNLKNRIKLILAEANKSNLPGGEMDLIFLRNSFHHLGNRTEYIKNLALCLNGNGKIVIIDHKKGHRSGPSMNHGTGEGEIEGVMEELGLMQYRSFDFLEGQWFFIYKKS